jgi:hypothetical protein
VKKLAIEVMFVLCLPLSVSFAQAPSPLIQNIYGRRIFSLNGDWHYIADSQEEGLPKIPFLRGMSPWILKDYRSPHRQLSGIQDGFNRKGLISETGQRKKAFYILQQFYRELAAERGGSK